MKAGSTQVELLFNHCNCNSRYSIDKNTQLKVYFMRFLSLQDRFGQKHVVEVLKEELEEGRWASFTFSANLEIKKKKKSRQHVFFLSVWVYSESSKTTNGETRFSSAERRSERSKNISRKDC